MHFNIHHCLCSNSNLENGERELETSFSETSFSGSVLTLQQVAYYGTVYSWTRTRNNFTARMLCSLHVQQSSNEPGTATGVVEEH